MIVSNEVERMWK